MDRTGDYASEKEVWGNSGETPAAGKVAGDRKPPQKLPAATETAGQPNSLIGNHLIPPSAHISEENDRGVQRTPKDD